MRLFKREKFCYNNPMTLCDAEPHSEEKRGEAL